MRTHVFDEGGGTDAVVCIHGNPDSADCWEPMLDRAGELGRMVAPDLPGAGHWPFLEAPRIWDRLAGFLRH